MLVLCVAKRRVCCGSNSTQGMRVKMASAHKGLQGDQGKQVNEWLAMCDPADSLWSSTPPTWCIPAA